MGMNTALARAKATFDNQSDKQPNRNPKAIAWLNILCSDLVAAPEHPSDQENNVGFSARDLQALFAPQDHSDTGKLCRALRSSSSVAKTSTRRPRIRPVRGGAAAARESGRAMNRAANPRHAGGTPVRRPGRVVPPGFVSRNSALATTFLPPRPVTSTSCLHAPALAAILLFGLLF